MAAGARGRVGGPESWLLALVLVVGVAVRTAAFGTIPPGLHQDEASSGYDAWALLHHGIDRNGYAYPVHLVAWGSGQNALYSYLAMPFIYVLGLDVWSVRLVNLLAGLASLPLCYALSRRWWDAPTALVATALLATCPWHVMLSRWGLESNLLPAVLLLAVWLLVRADERPIWLPGSCAAFATALYAYGSAYVVVPIVIGLSVLRLARQRRIPVRVWVASAAVFVVLALPIAAFVVINLWGLDEIRTAFMSVPRLPSRPRFTLVTGLSEAGGASIGHRLMALVRFLALQDDPRRFNVIPGVGLLYPFGFPLAVLGVAVVARQWRTRVFVLLAWLVASLVLGVVYVEPNANRMNAALLPLVLCTAAGIVAVVRMAWRRSPRLGVFASSAVLTVYLWYFARFTVSYFGHYASFASPVFFEGLTDAVRFAAERSRGTICVTDRAQMPYVFVLFATRTDPHRFLATVRYVNPGGDFQHVAAFDRWVFGLHRCPDLRTATLVLDRLEGEGATVAGRDAPTFGRYRVVLPDAS